MKLDATDLRILRLLQDDARLTNRELAGKIDLAPSTCLERVRRLRETGAIRGFHADADPAALGIAIQALVQVRLSRHNEGMIGEFKEQLITRREVVRLYDLAGAVDFIAHVVVRDVAHLHSVVCEAFSTHEIVQQIETFLVFEHLQKQTLPCLLTDEDDG